MASRQKQAKKERERAKQGKQSLGHKSTLVSCFSLAADVGSGLQQQHRGGGGGGGGSLYSVPPADLSWEASGMAANNPSLTGKKQIGEKPQLHALHVCTTCYCATQAENVLDGRRVEDSATFFICPPTRVV